jgi:uncharacterized phage-associated protein
MKLHFDEEKATQAAALFLQLRGAAMSYMKLLKLLYMADRTALLRWGRPITMDHYVSMKHGPVLSTVYDLITEEMPHDQSATWAKYISPPQNWEVHLLTDQVPCNRLSAAEDNLIREIFSAYGHFRRWDLVEHLHEILPEWKDPGDTSREIAISDILGADGSADIDDDQAERELYLLSGASAMLRAG